MADASIRVPPKVAPGEVFPVRAVVRHPMESGFRHDNVGKRIPRHVIEEFVCEYGGREVFRVQMGSGITTNPYFLFYVRGVDSGDMNFTWTDDRGAVIRATAKIEVAG